MIKQISFSIALITLTSVINLFSLQEISQLSEFQSFMNKGQSNGDNKPLIIKFYAKWCPACKAMDSVFSGAAEKYKDKAHFAAIDVANEELKKTLELFGIQGIPTIIYKRTGYEDEKAFDNRLKHFLSTAQKEAPKKTEKKKSEQKKIAPKNKKRKVEQAQSEKTVKKAQV